MAGESPSGLPKKAQASSSTTVGTPSGARGLARGASRGRFRADVKADLGNVGEIRKLVADTIAQFAVDILVNNAGVEKRAAFWDVNEEDYDKSSTST